jgi:hypothetical protein
MSVIADYNNYPPSLVVGFRNSNAIWAKVPQEELPSVTYGCETLTTCTAFLFLA